MHIASGAFILKPVPNSSSAPTLKINLPNLLTLARIAAVPVFVAVAFLVPGDAGRLLLLAIFVLASVTDWLDGYLARALNQQSAFGTMLDPIADKLLVAAALLLLVADGTIAGLHVLAPLIILSREVLVSGLREFLAGSAVKVPVTALAKWKTAVQMVAIAGLLAAPALSHELPFLLLAGLALLWTATVLTVWTGAGYLGAALAHTARIDRS